MNVYEKLNAVRLSLHEMNLAKSGWNDFGKWAYFELADFLVPALRLFGENKLCGMVDCGDGKASLRVLNTEKPDETIVFTVPLSTAALKGAHDVQNLGAVISYSRRYLWMMALEILEHDGLDGDKPKKPKSTTVAAAQFETCDNDTKDMLIRQADEVKKAFEFDSTEAYKIYSKHMAGMDSDTQVAFWSLFDSKQRTSIKASSEAARKAK